jgi:uncharacterized protein (TIGR03435 family)
MFAFPAANGRLQVHAATLRDLVGWAYGVLPSEVIGGPKWVGSTLFDIDAIADLVPRSTSDYALETPKRVEALLKERFQLEVHRETRTQSRYSLVLSNQSGRPGTGMKFASDGNCEDVNYTAGVPVPDVSKELPSWCGNIFGYQGHFHGTKISTTAFASHLSRIVQVPVIDDTGLVGAFDMDWNYNPSAQRALSSLTPTSTEGLTLFDALEEQLGLKLDLRRGSVSVVVIDRADPPEAN